MATQRAPLESHPAGTVRHMKDDGTWIVCEPHHPLYSTATMFAAEVWDADLAAWRKIFDDAQGAQRLT